MPEIIRIFTMTLVVDDPQQLNFLFNFLTSVATPLAGLSW